MNARQPIAIAVAFLAGAGFTYLVTSRAAPAKTEASDAAPPPAVGALPEDGAALFTVDKEDQAFRHLEQVLPPEAPLPPAEKPEEPVASAPKPWVGESAFPDAQRILADPFYNPGRRQLTSEGLQELRALLKQANAKERELQDAIGAQVEAHSHLLVEQGLGRPVAKGEKVKKSAPEHDTLSVIRDQGGSYAVSFTKHSVPEIAASMDARDELVKSTTTAIQHFFASH